MSGIATIRFYRVLKRRQAKEMIRALESRKGFVTIYEHSKAKTYGYASTLFRNRGMVIEISQSKGTPWGLYVYLNPALVVNSPDNLYKPTDKSYRQMRTAVDGMLSKINAPCGLEKMKLSQVSFALDLELNKPWKVAAYLDILRQGLLPRYYTRRPLQEKEVTSSTQHLREHFYRQGCKTATFSAGDKVAFDGLFTYSPLPQMDKDTLRLQLELHNKAIRRRLKRNAGQGHGKALMSLTEQADGIITRQLRCMKLLTGRVVSYEDAVDLVSGVKGKKTRKRMLYLLEETRGAGNLTTAVKRLKKRYDLGNRKVNDLFHKFWKLGISPVTLPDSAKKPLPGFDTILEHD